MKAILFCLFLTLTTVMPAMGQEGSSATVDGCPTVADWSAPGGVRLTSVPDGLRLSWMLPIPAPTDITGFQVVRATDQRGPFASVGLVNQTVTEFVDTTAVPGTIYYYRVRAFQGGACTPFSEPVFGQR